jgi:hypothetical protein
MTKNQQRSLGKLGISTAEEIVRNSLEVWSSGKVSACGVMVREVESNYEVF